jgi:hypothetical protein
VATHNTTIPTTPTIKTGGSTMERMERKRLIQAAAGMTIAASVTVLTTSPAGAAARGVTCALVGGDYWENGVLADPISPAGPSGAFPTGWAEGHGGCPLSNGGWNLCYSCTYACHEYDQFTWPYDPDIYWGVRPEEECHYLDDEQYENQIENCDLQYPGGWASLFPSEPQ